MGVGWGLASEAWAEPGAVRVFRRRIPSGSPAEGKLAAYTARKLRGMLYGRGRSDGDYEGSFPSGRAGRRKGLGPERESGGKMGFIQEKTKPGRVAKHLRKKRRGKEPQRGIQTSSFRLR